MLVSPLFIEVWLQILIPQSTENIAAENETEWKTCKRRGFNTPYQCLNPRI